MTTKRKRKEKSRKTQKVCSFCGKVCPNSSCIHPTCAVGYIEARGYFVVDARAWINFKNYLMGKKKLKEVDD